MREDAGGERTVKYRAGRVGASTGVGSGSVGEVVGRRAGEGDGWTGDGLRWREERGGGVRYGWGNVEGFG